MNNKQKIRDDIKKLRLDMEKEQYQACSDIICGKILESEFFKRANTVMAYCPISNEVDTSIVLEDCIKNKQLVLPKTNMQPRGITPYYIKCISDLKLQAYSIMEPVSECKKANQEDIEVVIVPLVAFDKFGTRIGYGGGFYDRFLQNAKNSLKVGIAFSFQQAENIDSEEHDIKLDVIVTEKDILYCT